MKYIIIKKIENLKDTYNYLYNILLFNYKNKKKKSKTFNLNIKMLISSLQLI